jgi:hypothetical protein
MRELGLANRTGETIWKSVVPFLVQLFLVLDC